MQPSCCNSCNITLLSQRESIECARKINGLVAGVLDDAVANGMIDEDKIASKIDARAVRCGFEKCIPKKWGKALS